MMGSSTIVANVMCTLPLDNSRKIDVCVVPRVEMEMSLGERIMCPSAGQRYANTKT